MIESHRWDKMEKKKTRKEEKWIKMIKITEGWESEKQGEKWGSGGRGSSSD